MAPPAFGLEHEVSELSRPINSLLLAVEREVTLHIRKATADVLTRVKDEMLPQYVPRAELTEAKLALAQLRSDRDLDREAIGALRKEVHGHEAQLKQLQGRLALLEQAGERTLSAAPALAQGAEAVCGWADELLQGMLAESSGMCCATPRPRLCVRGRGGTDERTLHFPSAVSAQVADRRLAPLEPCLPAALMRRKLPEEPHAIPGSVEHSLHLCERAVATLVEAVQHSLQQSKDHRSVLEVHAEARDLQSDSGPASQNASHRREGSPSIHRSTNDILLGDAEAAVAQADGAGAARGHAALSADVQALWGRTARNEQNTEELRTALELQEKTIMSMNDRSRQALGDVAKRIGAKADRDELRGLLEGTRLRAALQLPEKDVWTQLLSDVASLQQAVDSNKARLSEMKKSMVGSSSTHHPRDAANPPQHLPGGGGAGAWSKSLHLGVCIACDRPVWTTDHGLPAPPPAPARPAPMGPASRAPGDRDRLAAKPLAPRRGSVSSLRKTLDAGNRKKLRPWSAQGSGEG